MTVACTHIKRATLPQKEQVNIISSSSDQNVKNVPWDVNTSWGRCRGSQFMKFYVVVPHIQATRFTKCATEFGCASNSFLNGKIRLYVVQQMSVAKTPNGREWWQTNTCFATRSIFTLTKKMYRDLSWCRERLKGSSVVSPQVEFRERKINSFGHGYLPRMHSAWVMRSW